VSYIRDLLFFFFLSLQGRDHNKGEYGRMTPIIEIQYRGKVKGKKLRCHSFSRESNSSLSSLPSPIKRIRSFLLKGMIGR
jgi:hypothetical protein